MASQHAVHRLYGDLTGVVHRRDELPGENDRLYGTRLVYATKIKLGVNVIQILLIVAASKASPCVIAGDDIVLFDMPLSTNRSGTAKK